MHEKGVKRNRYPGVKPFETDQAFLFFGRDQDKDAFFRMVKLQNVVALYSKSGMGKSSLLNAGLIPLINQDGAYTPLRIRFEAWVEGKEDTPLDITRKKIAPDGSARTFLDNLIPDEPSLWHDIKEYQIQHVGKKGLLLIFDQFEELFSYPQPAIEEFRQHLAEAIYTLIPERYLNNLEEQIAKDELALSDEEIQLMQASPDLKVVISIRSDRLHLLDQLSSHIPAILKNIYELAPFNERQTRAAILEPANLSSKGLATPSFTYEEEAVQEMLAFLTKKGVQRVEPFQLQILCQAIERKVQREGQRISRADLGNVSEIYENYYENQLALIEDEEERKAAEYLLEEGLILEEEERRLSLYSGQILRDYHLDADALQRLVDCHLLRAEPTLEGGYLYELSHDSLIGPVLQAKKKHREEKIKAEEARRRQEQEEELRIQQERLAKELQLRRQAEQNARRARFWSLAASITAIAALALAIWSIQANVRSYVATAGTLGKEENYNEAIAQFERAKRFNAINVLRSFEPLNLADSIQAYRQREEQKEAYDALIANADSLYEAGEAYYMNAYKLYQDALNTGYRNNSRAQSMLSYIGEQEDNLFNKYLNEGDIFFNIGEWQVALGRYEIAKSYKPEDQRVASKIEEVKRRMN